MWRIIRLIFMGYWVDKPKPKGCTHEYVPVESFMNKTTRASGSWSNSKIYVNRCCRCGVMYHYEVHP